MRRGDARRLPIPDFSHEGSTISSSAAVDFVSGDEEPPSPDYVEDAFENDPQNVIGNIRTIEDLYTCIPEPDPDYQVDDSEDVTTNGLDFDDVNNFPPPPPPLTADELSSAVSAAYDASVHANLPVSLDPSNSESNDLYDSSFIQPKPLHNPCLESKERQALHRELVLNYKLGKDVLKKPELNKVLRERKATQKKKEWEEYQHSKGRTSLEIKLEERANRMKKEEDKEMNMIAEEEQTPELLRMHRKITLKPGKEAPPHA